MRIFLLKNSWWITLFAALILLILHTASIESIKIDNTSIILLLVVLMSPFISVLKKIKLGDFEAEIDPSEVRKLKENISQKLPDKSDNETEEIDLYDEIKVLAGDDYILALAKLRIEIEKILNKIYRQTEIDFDKGDNISKLPLWKLIKDLSDNKIIDVEIAKSLKEVTSLCNRAIHGEEVRKDDAESIVEIGIHLLESLHWKLSSNILEPIEVTEIDWATVNNYRNTNYEVTTIIPLIEKPVKNIRILNQEGLDDLLQGYQEYAEFIVEIKEMNKNTSA